MTCKYCTYLQVAGFVFEEATDVSENGSQVASLCVEAGIVVSGLEAGVIVGVIVGVILAGVPPHECNCYNYYRR